MPYCARCGVEVDEGVRGCPLCEAPIPVFDDDDGSIAAPSGRYPAPEEALDPLSPRQIRMTAWAVLSAVLVIAFAAVLAIDLVDESEGLGWSGYVLGALGPDGPRNDAQGEEGVADTDHPVGELLGRAFRIALDGRRPHQDPEAGEAPQEKSRVGHHAEEDVDGEPRAPERRDEGPHLAPASSLPGEEEHGAQSH